MAINEALFDILDSSLEDLVDLEKFEPAPAGNYRAQLNFERKEINDAPAVIVKLVLKECIELVDTSALVPAPDAKVDLAMILLRKDKETGELVPNSMGQGQLKEILKEIAPSVGGSTPTEIMDNAQGSEVYVTLGVRKDRNDPDKKYNNLKALTLA